VVLIAYPTDIELLVKGYKLLVSVYGRETVRAIAAAWAAGRRSIITYCRGSYCTSSPSSRAAEDAKVEYSKY
jgi:hypothetical protein